MHGSLSGSRNRIRWFFLLLAMMIPAVFPASASAHNVNVFAYVEGDEVFAEAYFADGGRCRGAAVEVYDENGVKIEEGTTDEEGRFSFRPQHDSDLLIRVNASMGHQAEYTIPASDLPAEQKPAASPKRALPENDAPEQKQPPQSIVAGAAPPEMKSLDAATLEEVIDRAVSRQVAPLRRAIEGERRRRRFLDVVGGIGYIIGIMGVIAYLRSRRNKNST